MELKIKSKPEQISQSLAVAVSLDDIRNLIQLANNECMGVFEYLDWRARDEIAFLIWKTVVACRELNQEMTNAVERLTSDPITDNPDQEAIPF